MSRHYSTTKTVRATKAGRGNNNSADLFKLAKAYDKIEKIKQQRRKSEMKEEAEDLKYNQGTTKGGTPNDTLIGLATMYGIAFTLLVFYICTIVFKIAAIVILIAIMYGAIYYTYLGVKYAIKFVKRFTNQTKAIPAG